MDRRRRMAQSPEGGVGGCPAPYSRRACARRPAPSWLPLTSVADLYCSFPSVVLGSMRTCERPAVMASPTSSRRRAPRGGWRRCLRRMPCDTGVPSPGDLLVVPPPFGGPDRGLIGG